MSKEIYMYITSIKYEFMFLDVSYYLNNETFKSLVLLQNEIFCIKGQYNEAVNKFLGETSGTKAFLDLSEDSGKLFSMGAVVIVVFFIVPNIMEMVITTPEIVETSNILIDTLINTGVVKEFSEGVVILTPEFQDKWEIIMQNIVEDMNLMEGDIMIQETNLTEGQDVSFDEFSSAMVELVEYNNKFHEVSFENGSVEEKVRYKFLLENYGEYLKFMHEMSI